MKQHGQTYLIVLLLSALLSACNHKDLDFLLEEEGNIRVTFDWAYASDAQPDGMLLAVFNNTSRPVSFHYPDQNGGELRLPGGDYQLIAHNDNTEYVEQRGTTWSDYELYTEPTTMIRFAPVLFTSRSVPRAIGTEDMEVVFQPDPVWCATTPSFTMNGIDGLTMSMESCTEVYSFTITNVKNLDHVVEIAASLSGLAGSYFPGLRQCSAYNCISPFEMTPISSDAISGTIRTWGNRLSPSYLEDDAERRLLVVYLMLDDGQKYYANFDVTDAIMEARRNAAGTDGEITLPITIDEFVIPEPLYNGTGLHPEVSEWNEVNISLRM